jgi:hypothetical protein
MLISQQRNELEVPVVGKFHYNLDNISDHIHEQRHAFYLFQYILEVL